MEQLGPSACFKIQKILGVYYEGHIQNFKVQWQPTWLTKSNLVGCEHLIDEFLREQNEKNDTADGMVDSETTSEVLEGNNVNVLVKEESTTDNLNNQDNVNTTQVISDGKYRQTEAKQIESFIYVGDDISFNNDILLSSDTLDQERNSETMIVLNPEEVDTRSHADSDEITFSGDQYFPSLRHELSELYNESCKLSKTTRRKMNISTAAIFNKTKKTERHLVDKRKVKTHETILKGEIPKNQCHLCGKIFCHGGNMARHLRIHAGDKRFSCHLCGAKCIQKHDLVRHMRVHTGEKPFQCTYCQRFFSLKSALRRHIRTHEKPEESASMALVANDLMGS